MGLLQKACETYDYHAANYAGVIREGHETLAPVSHMMTNAQIEITVNQDGKFIRAVSVDKSEPKIAIPVTEDSAGRTSAACPHPLCDQLCYLAPYNEKKHAMYVAQLTDWTESPYSHPKLRPILTYVKAGTILDDLVEANIIKLDKKGQPEKEKLLVRWKVTGLGEENSGSCWKDQSLFQSFIDYYSAQQKDAPQALCMISGEMAAPAKQHPKGIIPINGNAKLISANDKSGFTYRGRFSEDWQAGTVSYLASQKAHNALRWIASDQGTTFGGRTFLCWNPKGKPVPKPTGPLSRKGTAKAVTATEYKEQLRRILQGYRENLPDNEDVVIAAFDAATTGRLSLTYYNELLASDFLERLRDWDETCCWDNNQFGKQSPPLWQIVDCAFGTQRTEKGKTTLKTDERVMKQQMQRLLSCRVDRAKMPQDITKLIAQKASHLELYADDKESNYLRRTLLFTACAVIRKYRHDNKGEEWEMSLEPNKKDRSYQYGRLLAVMEKAERDTYSSDETRETNAIRMQPVFCQRPQRVSRVVIEQLKKAYLSRMKPASHAFYDKLIGEIYDQLSNFPEDEQKRPLEDTYLMGYYLQRNELYKSTKKTTEEHENEYSEEQD